MTVGELIEELKKYDLELPVMIEEESSGPTHLENYDLRCEEMTEKNGFYFLSDI